MHRGFLLPPVHHAVTGELLWRTKKKTSPEILVEGVSETKKSLGEIVIIVEQKDSVEICSFEKKKFRTHLLQKHHPTLRHLPLCIVQSRGRSSAATTMEMQLDWFA